MLLPNAGQAIIPPEKLRDYLLNPEHPQNRGKAGLFAALGFERADWRALAAAIREQHLPMEAHEGRPSPYGKTFEVVGELRGPRGSANIVTIWMIDEGVAVPRFLTAHPI